MALTDLFSNVHLLVRWLHVFAGIVWIGHLYFFNFVNGPFQGKLDAAMKRSVNPQLLPRALWWFRWGAMFTFLSGLVLFYLNYMYLAQEHLYDRLGFLGLQGRAWWILFGMLLGTIMWFNVWFIIWPAQKKLIPWLRDGVSAPEQPALAKRAALASRTNTFLSGPMLFAMVAAPHYSSLNLLTLVVVGALGLGAIWMAFKHAAKVGTTI